MTNTAKKIISLVVLVCFAMTQTVSANPGASIEIATRYETPSFLQIDIPAELATLDGLFEAPPRPDPRLVLHVQNAHANYGAQMKIKELLQYLHKTYGFKTIFVEGASEDLNPDYLRMFPDRERNMKLADFLMQQGELTGAELFILEQDGGGRRAEGAKNQDDRGEKADGVYAETPSSILHPLSEPSVRAHGIENAELYRENYDALKKVFGSGKTVTRYLGGYESRLDGLASKVFSPELRKLLGDWKKFEKGQREFMPYVHALTGNAKKILGVDLESLLAQVEWPQISRLLQLQVMEKELQTEKALAEKDKLITFLTAKRVTPELLAAIKDFQGQRVSVLRGKSDAVPAGLQPRDLMEKLVLEAGPKGFRFQDYPAFSIYAGYLILKNELDPKRLFEEIRTVFARMLDTLAKTPRQRELLAIYRDEELVRKLLNLELPRREWREAVAKQQELGMDVMVERLKTIGALVSKESNLPLSSFETKKVSEAFRQEVMGIQAAAFGFYDAARRREDVFYQKIEEVMTRNAESKAVLVTGGFHTDGITDLLREHQVSYGILTPRLLEKSDENLYRSVMLQNKQSTFELSYLEAVSRLQGYLAQGGQVGEVEVVASLEAVLRAIGHAGDLGNIADAIKIFNESSYAINGKIQIDPNPISNDEKGRPVYQVLHRSEARRDDLHGVAMPWYSHAVETGMRLSGNLFFDRGVGMMNDLLRRTDLTPEILERAFWGWHQVMDVAQGQKDIYRVQPEAIQQLFAKVLFDASQPVTRENVYEKVAELYYELHRMQPFVEGNHRAISLLVNFVFLKVGVPAFYLNQRNTPNYDEMRKLIRLPVQTRRNADWGKVSSDRLRAAFKNAGMELPVRPVRETSALNDDNLKKVIASFFMIEAATIRSESRQLDDDLWRGLADVARAKSKAWGGAQSEAWTERVSDLKELAQDIMAKDPPEFNEEGRLDNAGFEAHIRTLFGNSYRGIIEYGPVDYLKKVISNIRYDFRTRSFADLPGKLLDLLILAHRPHVELDPRGGWSVYMPARSSWRFFYLGQALFLAALGGLLSSDVLRHVSPHFLLGSIWSYGLIGVVLYKMLGLGERAMQSSRNHELTHLYVDELLNRLSVAGLIGNGNDARRALGPDDGLLFSRLGHSRDFNKRYLEDFKRWIIEKAVLDPKNLQRIENLPPEIRQEILSGSRMSQFGRSESRNSQGVGSPTGFWGALLAGLGFARKREEVRPTIPRVQGKTAGMTGPDRNMLFYLFMVSKEFQKATGIDLTKGRHKIVEVGTGILPVNLVEMTVLMRSINPQIETAGVDVFRPAALVIDPKNPNQYMFLDDEGSIVEVLQRSADGFLHTQYVKDRVGRGMNYFKMDPEEVTAIRNVFESARSGATIEDPKFRVILDPVQAFLSAMSPGPENSLGEIRYGKGSADAEEIRGADVAVMANVTLHLDPGTVEKMREELSNRMTPGGIILELNGVDFGGSTLNVWKVSAEHRPVPLKLDHSVWDGSWGYAYANHSMTLDLLGGKASKLPDLTTLRKIQDSIWQWMKDPAGRSASEAKRSEMRTGDQVAVDVRNLSAAEARQVRAEWYAGRLHEFCDYFTIVNLVPALLTQNNLSPEVLRENLKSSKEALALWRDRIELLKTDQGGNYSRAPNPGVKGHFMLVDANTQGFDQGHSVGDEGWLQYSRKDILNMVDRDRFVSSLEPRVRDAQEWLSQIETRIDGGEVFNSKEVSAVVKYVKVFEGAVSYLFEEFRGEFEPEAIIGEPQSQGGSLRVIEVGTPALPMVSENHGYWVDEITNLARQYVLTLRRRTLSEERLTVVEIPGRDRYLPGAFHLLNAEGKVIGVSLVEDIIFRAVDPKTGEPIDDEVIKRADGESMRDELNATWALEEAWALKEGDKYGYLRAWEAGVMANGQGFWARLKGPKKGQDLSQANPRLSVIDLFKGLADAGERFVQLHQAGLIHGDIKPGNILLGEDPKGALDVSNSYVIDLTGVQQLGANPDAETVLGTTWMNPLIKMEGRPVLLQGWLRTQEADVFQFVMTIVSLLHQKARLPGANALSPDEAVRLETKYLVRIFDRFPGFFVLRSLMNTKGKENFAFDIYYQDNEMFAVKPMNEIPTMAQLTQMLEEDLAAMEASAAGLSESRSETRTEGATAEDFDEFVQTYWRENNLGSEEDRLAAAKFYYSSDTGRAIQKGGITASMFSVFIRAMGFRGKDSAAKTFAAMSALRKLRPLYPEVKLSTAIDMLSKGEFDFNKLGNSGEVALASFLPAVRTIFLRNGIKAQVLKVGVDAAAKAAETTTAAELEAEFAREMQSRMPKAEIGESKPVDLEDVLKKLSSLERKALELKVPEVRSRLGRAEVSDEVILVALLVGGILDLSKADLPEAKRQMMLLAATIGGEATLALKDAFKKAYEGQNIQLPVSDAVGLVVDILDAMPSSKKIETVKGILALNPSVHFAWIVPAEVDVSETVQKITEWGNRNDVKVEGRLLVSGVGASLVNSINSVKKRIKRIYAFVVIGRSGDLADLKLKQAELIERGNEIPPDVADVAGIVVSVERSQELVYGGEKFGEKTAQAINAIEGKRFAFNLNGLLNIAKSLAAQLQGLLSLEKSA